MANTISSINKIKAVYDRDYRDRKFGGDKLTFKWLLRILNPKKNSRLLDIGCGQGFLLREAERLGLVTYGIDISSEAVDIARRNSPSSNIICGDGHRLVWEDGYFDYITNIGSLEHFLEPERCLREMQRVMKKDGRACMMVPNLYYYRHIINNFLRRRKPTSYQLIERFAPLREWKNLIEENGFRIERIHKYNKFNRPKPFVFIRALIIPLYFSHHFVFVCSKK